MISNKIQVTKRARMPKMNKNIERLYKEGKCSDCSVIVTRMDFAKILGKFTKVKIQYECSTPKSKRSNQQITSPNSRLKSNENGMVLLPRKAYSQHPVKVLTSKHVKNNTSTPKAKNSLKESNKPNTKTTPPRNNILKENNRIKKIQVVGKDSNNLFKRAVNSNQKTYAIVFNKPMIHKTDQKSKLTLTDLLPLINPSILPSEGWCIDYLPTSGEPKEDKVYDRIAAELEDLMNSETSAVSSNNKVITENKDDFPSILDILNENTTGSNYSNNQSDSTDFKSSLESSDDVEAILMGKTDEPKVVATPMEVNNTDVSNLISAVSLNTAQTSDKLPDASLGDGFDNPHSPSILDEALQKGIEEHLPAIESEKVAASVSSTNIGINLKNTEIKDSTAGIIDKENESFKLNLVTHVLFKKRIDGVCYKSVTCPKNLKYSVELEGKSVEFLGAPKFISSIEDLRVLLQIVNESNLKSLYVLH